MGYQDEEILAKRKAFAQQQEKEIEKEKIEAEKQESIFDGMIHLFGKEVTFSRREYEEYGISLLIPDEFEELDQEMKDLIYPYGKAPKYALASGNIPFQVTLNLTENIVPNEGMPKFMVTAKAVMERIGPQARIFSNNVVKKGDRNIGIMEIATKAVDMPVFNTQFYLSLEDNKLFIGAVTCPAKNHDRMLKIIKEIIDSVEIKEDKKDGDNNISES